MLKIHSFVRNEHTCLLSADANISPRLPFPILDFRFLDFGLRCKKIFSLLADSLIGRARDC